METDRIYCTDRSVNAVFIFATKKLRKSERLYKKRIAVIQKLLFICNIINKQNENFHYKLTFVTIFTTKKEVEEIERRLQK